MWKISSRNPEHHVMLDYEDFKCLVRGGVLKVRKDGLDINLALQDIGYHMMDEAISLADQKIDIYKNHEKVIE